MLKSGDMKKIEKTTKDVIDITKKRIKKEQIYADLNLSLINIENEVFGLPKEQMEQEFTRLISNHV